ncbi:ribbon-helix-helix protein, CopG family [Thermococcus aciditolerans]|nr:ribbon-helix-helix protein, CopG family [Thermococcus aciditolerans]
MRTKTVSARVSPEFYERVKSEAEKRGVTVSDVVRRALEREFKPWWRFW